MRNCDFSISEPTKWFTFTEIPDKSNWFTSLFSIRGSDIINPILSAVSSYHHQQV